MTCPLLPELITEGDSIQEAILNANDALEAIVEGYTHLDRELPPGLQPALADVPIWIETILSVP